MKKMICECRDGCACATNPGPALYLIKRAGKEMKVCTRCTMTDDQKVRFLKENPVTSDEIIDYDPMGWFCATMCDGEVKNG